MWHETGCWSLGFVWDMGRKVFRETFDRAEACGLSPINNIRPKFPSLNKCFNVPYDSQIC